VWSNFAESETSLKARTKRCNWTELNWHGLVSDELTNGPAGQAHCSLVDAHVRVVTQSPTPLDGAYCSTFLLAHWSVCQKPNHVKMVWTFSRTGLADMVTATFVHENFRSREQFSFLGTFVLNIKICMELSFPNTLRTKFRGCSARETFSNLGLNRWGYRKMCVF